MDCNCCWLQTLAPSAAMLGISIMLSSQGPFSMRDAAGNIVGTYRSRPRA